MRAQVILLFQCIDGVDTCLYALYMQEYGDDCPAPNRKWIYLSYLDSIKYMRPDNVESARPGLALRTLVYHQIIISYLAYVKARGFTSMFIWACPPLQARPPSFVDPGVSMICMGVGETEAGAGRLYPAWAMHMGPCGCCVLSLALRLRTA